MIRKIVKDENVFNLLEMYIDSYETKKDDISADFLLEIRAVSALQFIILILLTEW